MIYDNEEPYNYIDRFCTPWARGKGRKYSIFMIVFLIYGNYIVIQEICTKDLFHSEPIYNAFIAMLFLVLFSYHIVLFCILFINIWLFAYEVEIYNDYFICYNAFGKEVNHIFYSDVLMIKKTFPNVANNMKIVTTKCKIQIWGGINRYGECIENICLRSVNLKLVDYGGLDSSKIWTRNDEKFEGQP